MTSATVTSTVPDHIEPVLERLGRRAFDQTPHAKETIEVTAPATGEVLGEVPRGTPKDVADAVARARLVQLGWAAWPVKERAAVLRRLHDLVLDRRSEAMDLVQLESGKARVHAFDEVIDIATTARYYANTAPGLLATKGRQGAVPLLTRAWEHHHPRGVIGCIAPWNYPLAQGVCDMIPALVAGNGAVVKPDQQTPYGALWAAELLEAAGLPAGLVQVVTGAGSQLGEPIVEETDFVMFTGSTAVGRTVAEQAGRRLKECSMELGGKNAMIVLADADLDKTAIGTMRAAFTNAGQLCISMERLYVHESIAGEFTERIVAETEKMRLGTSLDWEADMGSLISAKQLETVTRHVDGAVDQGAEVLTGGRPRPDLGPYFYEPTILRGVTPAMEVFGHETFGPVLSVYVFSTDEEAVRLANDSPYGLNFSVWTRDEKAGRRLATRLEAGTVCINEGYAAAWGSLDAPMGGVKESGFGRRHGAHGLLKYTESQTVAAQRLVPLSTPPLSFGSAQANLMSTALKVLARIPGIR